MRKNCNCDVAPVKAELGVSASDYVIAMAAALGEKRSSGGIENPGGAGASVWLDRPCFEERACVRSLAAARLAGTQRLDHGRFRRLTYQCRVDKILEQRCWWCPTMTSTDELMDGWGHCGDTA